MNVIDGRTIGCWFPIDRPRAAKTKFFGLHWTGGVSEGTNEEQARRVYNTLVARGDSIHYVCCSDGTFVQMADLDAHCVHIGSAHNDDTVGVEFVCPGSSGIVPTEARPKFEAKVHGSSVTFYGFTPAQVKAAAEMAQAVMWRYGIAYLSTPVCVEDMLPEDFTEGVIGHYQVSSDKVDPGPQTMYQVRSRMIDSKIWASLLWSAVGEGVRRYFLLRM